MASTSTCSLFNRCCSSKLSREYNYKFSVQQKGPREMSGLVTNDRWSSVDDFQVAIHEKRISFRAFITLLAQLAEIAELDESKLYPRRIVLERQASSVTKKHWTTIMPLGRTTNLQHLLAPDQPEIQKTRQIVSLAFKITKATDTSRRDIVDTDF